MPGIKCSEAEGAFYLFPNVSHYYSSWFAGKAITNSEEFCSFLLEQAHVAVIPGIGFESPENVRLAYATSLANIKEGMDRMEAALALLETDKRSTAPDRARGKRAQEVGR
jgi:aspartate aminotransferase